MCSRTLPKEKTFYDKFQRKIQEQYLALQIEKKMDKSEIIESYLNTINLGQNCLGVQLHRSVISEKMYLI